jgi:hypothetical protein
VLTTGAREASADARGLGQIKVAAAASIASSDAIELVAVSRPELVAGQAPDVVDDWPQQFPHIFFPLRVTKDRALALLVTAASILSRCETAERQNRFSPAPSFLGAERSLTIYGGLARKAAIRPAFPRARGC